jgi:hypothetical protein
MSLPVTPAPFARAAPVLPDYAGGGLVNLMASVLGAFGARPDHPELRLLPAGELAAARNVVLLLVDGLGYHYLERHAAAGGALRRHLRGTMTSVFPSTTATAITALHTGFSPRQHGLTGWFTWLAEAGGVAAVLPFRRRDGGAPLAELGVDPGQVFVGPPLFERLDGESWVISPRAIIDSDYSRVHCGGARRVPYGALEELFGLAAAAVRQSRRRAYVYAYLPDFDALAHARGVGSPECLAVLRRVETGFEALLGALAGTGTTVIVTADHGFIDTVPERRLDLADFPGLAELLDGPLWGEPRAAYCRALPGRAEELARRAARALAGAARVYPSGKLLADGWFGRGATHPRFAERIGDFTLVMEQDYALRDWLPEEKRIVQVGVHGGVSEAEMRVPLVAVNV